MLARSLLKTVVCKQQWDPFELNGPWNPSAPTGTSLHHNKRNRTAPVGGKAYFRVHLQTSGSTLLAYRKRERTKTVFPEARLDFSRGIKACWDRRPPRYKSDWIPAPISGPSRPVSISERRRHRNNRGENQARRLGMLTENDIFRSNDFPSMT